MSVGLVWPVFSALRGVSLSFASPKESKQRKGDPRVGARYAGPLRYSKPAGAAELGPAGLKQSSPSFRRFLRCSAPLMGTPKTSRNDGSAQEEKRKCLVFNGRPLKTTQNHLQRFGGDAFRVPLGGAEQRRLAGGFGLRLSEPQASLASRPASRVAQGTGQRPAPTRGSPFLWLLSFGEAKESTPARKAESSRQTRTTSPVSKTKANTARKTEPQHKTSTQPITTHAKNKHPRRTT